MTNFTAPLYNGLTFGAGKQAAGISNIMANLATGNRDFRQNYKQGKEDFEKDLAEVKEKYPISSVLAELAGGVLSGGAVAKLLSKGLSIGQILKEQHKIKKAYNAVKSNPFAGKSEDVLVKLKPNGETFEINRGAIVKDPLTGEFITSGRRLRELTQGKHYGNFGLTKTIFKHNIQPEEIASIPKILRQYNPAETIDGKIVYRTLDKEGNSYRQVWGIRPDETKRMITFFKEDKVGKLLSKKR